MSRECVGRPFDRLRLSGVLAKVGFPFVVSHMLPSLVSLSNH